MKATELYPEGVSHVVQLMREKDKAEIYCTQWSEDPGQFTASVLGAGGLGFVLHANDGEPVVCCGALPMWRGVWSVWMFATDRFEEISLSTHRFARKIFFPALDEAGWHRLECRSISTHDVAHRWLELLGARKECEVSGYGKAGEDFNLYCWTKELPSRE
jgi:hypothetical protein